MQSQSTKISPTAMKGNGNTAKTTEDHGLISKLVAYPVRRLYICPEQITFDLSLRQITLVHLANWRLLPLILRLHTQSRSYAEVNPFQLSAVKDDANPSVVDIDSDGDLDLFVGDLKDIRTSLKMRNSRESDLFIQEKCFWLG